MVAAETNNRSSEAAVLGCRQNLPRNADDCHVLNTRVMLAGAVSRTISDGSCNCGDSRAGDRIARHCR
jgi:hypothetical protein